MGFASHSRVVVVVTLMSFALPAVAQSDEPVIRDSDVSAPERALALHDEARRLYTRGRYREAIAKLQEAVRVDPTGKVLYYNLGLIHEKLAEFDEALANYRTCLELEGDEREKVGLAKTIKRVEGAKQFVTFDRGPQPSAPAAPRPLDDGVGEASVSPWTFVVGALALSGVALGATMAARAAALDPGDAPQTGGDISVASLQDDADAAHSSAIVADVSFAVGGAAALTTVVIALTTFSIDPPTNVSMAPGGVAWRF